MARITFKGKIRTVYNTDDSVAWRYIAVPKLARAHCDMHAFRMHPKFGGLANSDLFPNVLERIAREKFGRDGKTLRLDKVPEGVEIDEAGFLAVVAFDV